MSDGENSFNDVFDSGSDDESWLDADDRPRLTSPTAIVLPVGCGVAEGDRAICLWRSWTYYPGVVHSFDAAARTFSVAFDDGDAGTAPAAEVFADAAPSADAVAVGTDVVFTQGTWESVDSMHALRLLALTHYICVPR